MSLAMKRLKNLGWLALVFLVAIMLYPLSLNVAALHSDLVRVDNKILQTKREISFLQAEIRTRASVQQLGDWNELLYGYAPPTAEQFAGGEAALAGIGGDAPLVKPVLVAVTGDGISPSGVIGAARNDADATEKKPGDVSVSAERPTAKLAQNTPVVQSEKEQKQRVADMSKKLLSDDLLKEISDRADREARRR